MAQTINVTTDTEINHNVTDAHPISSKTETLKIQCDHHGLSVEFPNGDLIVIDLSFGVFNVLHFGDGVESAPLKLVSINS